MLLSELAPSAWVLVYCLIQLFMQAQPSPLRQALTADPHPPRFLSVLSMSPDMCTYACSASQA